MDGEIATMWHGDGMRGGNVRCLIVLASLSGALLTTGVLTVPAASALDSTPWTGSISYSETVSGGMAAGPEVTCSTSNGSESTSSSVQMNWHGQVTISGISFTTQNLGNDDALLYAPADESMSYDETTSFGNPDCKTPTEHASGSFSGVGNAGGKHDSVSVVVSLLHDSSNDLGIDTGAVLITGESSQTGYPGSPPPENDSARWGSNADTIDVSQNQPVVDNTFHDIAVGDSASGIYGETPMGAGITTSDTVTIHLTHGTAKPPVAPTTKITKGPATKTTAKQARFAFTSTTKGATFKCSIDGKAAKTCTTPTTYTGLKAGKHRFSVYAVDPATKLRDKTPAKRVWTVKKKPKK